MGRSPGSARNPIEECPEAFFPRLRTHQTARPRLSDRTPQSPPGDADPAQLTSRVTWRAVVSEA